MKFLFKALLGVGLGLFSNMPLQAANESSLPVLRWGADAQSGVPYVFYTTAQPQRLIGFEVEIIESVARYLGMQTKFIQNEWPSLIPGLQRHLYDVGINGLVPPTSGNIEGVYFSDPYLITYMQLTVQETNEDIKVLADCRGKKVGVLIATPAVGLLQEIEGVEIRLYDTELNAFNDLAFGRLDAVLMDFPLALYYGGANPLLKLVGPEIDRSIYAIGISAGCGPEFVEQINAAMRELKNSGELRQILDRWNLWNPYMADLLHDYRVSTGDPLAFEAYNDFVREREAAGPTFKDRLKRYWGFMPLLLEGAWMTIQVSVISMMFAVTLGLIIALMRVYGAAPLRFFASSYVEIIRGTPLLIQLFLIFYGLPNVGIKLDPFTAGVVGLGLNYAAYEAENYRAGLLSVPEQQLEAASALAMSHSQALRFVIIPQAGRLVIPPMTNDFIALVKDSSLVSMITITELTQRYNELATTYYDYFGIGLLAGGMYMLLGLPFIRLAKLAEQRLARHSSSSKA